MKRAFVPFVTVILVWLVLGCAKNENFHFSKDTGGFSFYHKVNPETKKTHFELAPEDAIVDTVFSTASAQPSITKDVLRPHIKLANTPPQAVTYYQLKKRPQLTVLQIKAPLSKLLLKKKLRKLTETGNKPTHKLATIGLILGLASISSLLLLPFITGITGILITLMGLSVIGGIVTSSLALKKIKKYPDTYAGKGKALAGLFISLVTTVLFLQVLIIGLLLQMFINMLFANMI